MKGSPGLDVAARHCKHCIVVCCHHTGQPVVLCNHLQILYQPHLLLLLLLLLILLVYKAMPTHHAVHEC